MDPFSDFSTDMDFSTEPPTKRRRFFKDEDDDQNDDQVTLTETPQKRFFKDTPAPEDEPRILEGRAVLAEKSDNVIPSSSPHLFSDSAVVQGSAMTFDTDMFQSFVGTTVSQDVLDIIKESCGDNLERAVNMYFDGSYKKLKKPACKPRESPGLGISKSSMTVDNVNSAPYVRRPLQSRYIGAFGVEGWATRSGVEILKHGDVIKIERQKIQPPQPAKLKTRFGMAAPPPPLRGNSAAARRVDVIVRFTNESGMEIGRLAKETAKWVSTLLDQGICSFEGTCVYAPERLRTNDTVFLQLRCNLLKTAFQSRGFQLADDRSTGLFDAKETQDEKDLNMRQVALVRMFQEVNLQPSKANAASKDGRARLLQAAEADEQKQKEKKKSSIPPPQGSSSPNSDDEEGEELEQDQLDALYKKAQSFDFNTPEAEPADTFAMDLRRYQKQALHWMVSKEKDQKSNREPSMHPLWEEYIWPTKDVDDKDLPPVPNQPEFWVNPYSGDLSLEFPAQEQHCLGGILADEMGLGKTIQMLSLIHTHRSELADLSTSTEMSTVNQLPRLGGTTAAVLAAPRTTLVIAPMSLLSQWHSEAVKASKDGTLKIELYYGNEKAGGNLQALCCSANVASAPDVVITSYGVVLSEFSSIAAKKGDKTFHNGLFSLKFFRIILDEGHHIKNRGSKTARACYELSAEHRWILTGTPIVNKLEDLFSLVRFLGVEPWNNFSFWKTFITVPFESGEFVRALDVVQTVLEPLVMRRTKDMKTPDGLPLVPLPPKQVDIVDVELSKTERDIYDYIFTKAKRTLAINVAEGTVLKAFTTIFAQILRLRQSCCHPTLVRHRDIVADEVEASAVADVAAGLGDDMDLDSLLAQFAAATEEAALETPSFGTNALQEIQDEAERECPLCFDEPMNDQIVTGCWHSACKKCLLDFTKHESDRGVVPKCFNCRAPLNNRDLFEVIRHDDDGLTDLTKPRISLQRLGTNASSAKVVALISHLRTLRREHPFMKSVIFSQFTSFLSLIEPALTRANVSFLRLDGTMAQRARAAVLEEFAARKGFTVLLISLRAGGVGLNLTSASRVFMMDPWWSFAVEAQAIDRVHRMGQEDEVVVKRFIVRGSVEERMLKIQDRKKFIASSLGMMSDEEKKLQRIEDIKQLLS